ncbi:MAG: PQ-loop repeat-containing protein [Patescibacteria group bacterium]
MKFDLAQILGWIATFLFSVMLIPQMVKTIKVKDTSGVSRQKEKV